MARLPDAERESAIITVRLMPHFTRSRTASEMAAWSNW